MDIYNTEEKLQSLISKLNESKKENIKLLLEFERDLQLRNIGKQRILKYLYCLIRLGKIYKIAYKELTNKDVENIILKIDSSSWGEWTRHDYKIVFRIFCNWLNKKYSKDLDLSWLKVLVKNKKIMPEELITDEEFKELLDACDEIRDKALLYVLYESGCRIGEIITLQLKHITFDEYGAVLIVNGKTGQRRVRLISSASYLSNYIDTHPFKNNSESYLWLTKFNREKDRIGKYTPLRYRGVLKLFNRLKQKTNLGKRIHPHLFRHSRATKLANYLTEAQMKEIFGWTQRSNMASIYVHLSGRDTDQALLKAYGLSTDEQEKMKAVYCIKCREPNSPLSERCKRCGYPLDEKEIRKIESKDELLFEFLSAVSEEFPQIKQRFRTIVKDKKMEDLFK